MFAATAALALPLIWFAAPSNNVPPELMTIELVLPSAPLALDESNSRVPPFTVVTPVKVLPPVNTHSPAPLFVTAVEPVPLSAITGANVFAAVFVPCSVSVGDTFVPENAIAVVLLNVTAPVPEASSVPPDAPSVKSRFVLAVAPVYCSVPPFIIKFTADEFADPIPLAVPPFASVLTLNVPAVIVVFPVYVLAELIVTVFPAPFIDKFPVPAKIALTVPPLNANEPPVFTVKLPVVPASVPLDSVTFPAVITPLVTFASPLLTVRLPMVSENVVAT
jgi:hypothetical protein